MTSPTGKSSAPITTSPNVAQPVNQNNNPADAKTKDFFATHGSYLFAWALLVGTALLWKGKVAAVAVGLVSAVAYAGYSYFISGRSQLPANSANPSK